MMRYAIWNNKGGVGKTFLSFTLGTELCRIKPDHSVLLVDMCPQANLSEIILGGNGKGASNLEEILKKGKGRKSIGGYLDERIESPHTLSGNETNFLIQGKEYNENIPDNLYLISGDPSLEIQAQAINQISSQSLPENSWKNVHSWLKDLVLACIRKLGSERTIVLIDCNPSFSAYTELAMVASEKLIIPCSSDGSSARAIDNIASLLYGMYLSDGYKSVNFSSKIKQYNLALPKIHAVLLNRSTQYNESASKAFSAMFSEIRKRIKRTREREDGQRNFTSDMFDDEVPDSHSVAIVCSHLGIPFSKLRAGKYQVHDTQPQVNSGPLERYREAIDRIIQKI